MDSFYSNFMQKLLNLQGVFIYKVNINETNYKIKIGFGGKIKCCPNCESTKFIKFGFSKYREVKHGILLNGLPVFLNFRRRRFRCKKCNKIWSKKLPINILSPRKRITKIYEKQLLRKLRTSSFKDTCDEMQTCYSVARKILENNISNNILLKIPPKGNLIIGLDEHSRCKQEFATTITLLNHKRRVLGILPYKNNKLLLKWFIENWTKAERKRVKEVCVDMAKCWPSVIKKVFPNAKIVLDHFHIIKYLNDLTIKEFGFAKYNNPKIFSFGISKLLRQGGKHWSKNNKKRMAEVFKSCPRVAELWYWKEEVRRIYRECLTKKKEARKRWKIVLNNLDKVPKNTLENHLEYILNYFDNRTTNAFTEGVHTKFKLIKRYSYGIKNITVYLKKLFLGLLKPENLIINNSIC